MLKSSPDEGSGDRPSYSNEKSHSLRSRSFIGVAVISLILLMQCREDNRLQRNSAQVFLQVNQKNITINSSELYDPPSSYSIKKKNVTHSENPLDYNMLIIHYHKTGNSVAGNLLNLLLREGEAIGLRGRNSKKKRHRERHGPEYRESTQKVQEEAVVRISSRTSANGVWIHESFGNTQDKDEGHAKQTVMKKNYMNGTNVPFGDRYLARRSGADNSDKASDDYVDDNDYDDDDSTEEQHICSRRLSSNKLLRELKREKKRRNRRWHDLQTNCPQLHIKMGGLQVLTAPDFFCSMDVLDEVLMPRFFQLKSNRTAGTKIIHMVRDPFEMALSNYFYHSQQPTPEKWVMDDCSPCDSQYYDTHSRRTNTTSLDLLLPTLETITRAQIDKVQSLCQSIFQNPENPDLLHAPLYDHLLKLEGYDGLRLATTRQLIGSGGDTGNAGGDILRMANNVLKLDQFVVSSTADVQIMTTYMSHWVSDPKETALAATDFLLGGSLTREKKLAVALQYAEKYVNKTLNDTEQHITSNMDYVRDQKQKLMALLRADPILAPVLIEVQKILRLYS